MDNMKIDVLCTAGRDPEQRYTDKGKLVTSVSAAAEMGSGDYKKTEWVQITVWGEKYGNLFNSMVQKGTFLLVSGSPSVNVWVGKDGEAKGQLNITLKDFRVLRNGKPKDSGEADDDEPDFMKD